MTKLAILSDIHANSDALRTVLALCGELQVERYVCLGDIIGYNAEPLKCVQLVRALNPVALVRGNHDDYTASDDEVMEGFNPNARRAILWTRSQLSEEDRKWLGMQPLRTSIPGAPVTLVHATLDSPDTWGYVFDVYHAVDNFSYQLTQICFCGHSHVPVAFCKKPFAAGPLRGTETCDVAGDILLNATMASLAGEGQFGDRAERSFFNAGAACVSRDFMHHVYFQTPNRPDNSDVTSAGPHSHGGNGCSYETKHWPLCCTAALTRILPGFVQWMWMKPRGGGLAAVFYGPNMLQTSVDGISVRIETTTDYPFNETLQMRVETAKPVRFPQKRFFAFALFQFRRFVLDCVFFFHNYYLFHYIFLTMLRKNR